MAALVSKTPSNINPFRNKRFNLGTTKGTLLKKLTPVEIHDILKQKERQEQERRINKLYKELDIYIDIDNKSTIKEIIKKTDGYYKLETYVKFVSEVENRCQKVREFMGTHKDP